jgi:uncharacterized GH25 family protein
MKRFLGWAALALAATAMPMTADAHRAWLLPSATVLSGNDVWVTVDAAISNDLFYFEHHPLRLNALAVTAPDGSAAQPQNLSSGRYRSTFDLQLTQPGTYKISVNNDGLFATYRLNGEQKRWRGAADRMATEIPADAKELRVTQTQNRLELFVTAGKQSDKVLQPSLSGLELVPVTHPNDLVVGEPARFRMLLDGKPAAGIEVAVIPGGIRYRDKLNDMTVKTDDDGAFSVKWPGPGMYWLNASVQDDKASVKDAKRRASYTVTLEVLPD